MWPFSKKKKLQKQLSKHVSADVAKKMILNEPLSLELRSCLIHFALIQIKDERLEEIDGLIASAVEVLMRRDFAVASISSSLILATLGLATQPPANPTEICEHMANELISGHSGKVKVLFGSVSGEYGMIGHAQCKLIGPLIPRFGSMLKQLTDLEYGECRRIM